MNQMNATQTILMSRLERSHWWYVATHELVEACVRKFVGEGKSIFDAGCGTGGLLRTLSTVGAVRGCDASPLCVRLARKKATPKYRANVYEHRVEGIHHFETNTFECITCIDVLYHRGVPNWRVALKDLMQILRPGGHLILQVPAFSMLHGSHDVAVQGERRFNRAEIELALQEFGFQIRLSTYRFSHLFPAVLARRLVSRIGTPAGDCRSDFESILEGPALGSLRDFAERMALFFARLENCMVLRGLCAPLGSSLFLVARNPR